MFDTAPLPPISSRLRIPTETMPPPAGVPVAVQRAAGSRFSGRFKRVLRASERLTRLRARPSRRADSDSAAAAEIALKPLAWTLAIWVCGLGCLALAWALRQAPAEADAPVRPSVPSALESPR